MEIKLTKNKVTLIDDEDAERVLELKWHVSRSGSGIDYAGHTKKIHGGVILLHRYLLDAPDGMFVDHINGDTLDNRKSNLRICTHKENLRNQRTPKNNNSGFKGVMWYKRISKWRAYIRVDKVQFHLGYFETKEDAALAYNISAIKHFGQYAKLNNIKEGSKKCQ